MGAAQNLQVAVRGCGGGATDGAPAGVGDPEGAPAGKPCCYGTVVFFRF
jgi:hypothetical protein